MANISILAAFERMWQHITVALNNKADKSVVDEHETAISTAQSTANTAQSMATSANSTAVEAMGAAQTAQSEVDALETVVDGYADNMDYVSSIKTYIKPVSIAGYEIGYRTISKGMGQVALGKYNTEYTSSGSLGSSAMGSIFIVGVGTSDTARANAFRITNAGKCMGTASFVISGADYAEYYEWLDGNPDNEDRRGYFVTLDGVKIRKATAEDDYVLGVISSTPAVIGNGYTDMWKDMYLTDVFGERLTEIVEVEETTDENGNVIPAHTETRFIINPEYDHTQKYIGRDQRKEWAAVGTHGQLVVIDDGTCEVNAYCRVANDGTATKADGKTEYRVTERLDDTHIRITIK